MTKSICFIPQASLKTSYSADWSSNGSFYFWRCGHM